MRCRRCQQDLKESDIDVYCVSVQGPTSAFYNDYYHDICLARDHIDSLKSEIKSLEELVLGVGKYHSKSCSNLNENIEKCVSYHKVKSSLLSPEKSH